MSERKESSVLFSLRELQTIEEERVSEEAQAAIQAAENVRQAKAAEVQAVRDAEEARRQAAELAERHAREEVERKQREEQMRLEDSERRARVDAQAMIEQQRLAKEMELKVMEAKRKKPAWIIAAIGAVVLVAGVGFFIKNQSDNRAEAKAAEEAQAIATAEAKAEIRKLAVASAQLDLDTAANDEAFKKALADVAAANTAEERAAATKNMKARKAEAARLADLRKSQAKAAAKAKRKADKKKFNKCANSSDPLCGL